MSKFKLIQGANITDLTNKREVLELEIQIRNKLNVTNKDLIVYAYHFVRLGNVLLANKYLNRLDANYFDIDVYKDLSKALLAWATVQSSKEQDSKHVAAVYEYFIILKRSLEMFENVNFISKPAFYRFKKQFHEFTTIPHVN